MKENGLFYLNEKGSLLQGCAVISQLLEIPVSKIPGKHIYHHIVESEKKRAVYKFSRLLKEQTPVTFKTSINSSCGAVISIEVKLLPYNYKTHTTGVIGVVRKIPSIKNDKLFSYYKNLDATAKVNSNSTDELLERYILAASATGDLLYDLDLVTANVFQEYKFSENYLGYTREEMKQPHFWDEKIHPSDSDRIQENLQKILSSKEKSYDYEYRFKKADGSYAFLIDRGLIIRDAQGKARRLVGVTSDISHNESILRELIASFKLVLRATTAIFWEIEQEVLGREKNTALFLSKKLGYAVEQKTSGEFLWYYKVSPATLEKAQNSLQAALEDPKQKKWEATYQFIKTNGEVGVLIDQGFISRDETGKPIKIVGAMMDISETHSLIQEVQEQNRLLKEITWEQSHIVRAPLARLKGLLQYLGLEDFQEVSQTEIFKNIKSSAEELDEIVKGIIMKTESIEARTKKSSSPNNFVSG